jgi:hypothetical protein
MGRPLLKRSIKLLLIAAVASVLLVPVAAVGSHDFTDVPDSNVFHADISWLADANVTLGCNPPANDMFCPGNAVTRQQMAAFMRRLATNQVVDAGMLDGMDSSDFLGVTDTAADSDLLDGMTTDDLKTLTFAAVEVGAGTGIMPSPTIGPLMTLDFAVPVDGSILVTHSTSLRWVATDSAYATAPTLGSCGPEVFALGSLGEVSAPDEYDTAAGVLPFNVAAGSHTLTLCGSAEFGDLNLLMMQMGVVFEPGGTAPEIVFPPITMSTDSGGWK